MRKKWLVLTFSFLGALGDLTFLPWAGSTGDYHSGQYLLCYDCHNKQDGLSEPVKHGQVADRGR